MILDQLIIMKKQSYEPDPDGYKGTIKFTSTTGKIEVNLSDALSRKILAIISEELVETAKLVGNLLTQEIIQNAPQAITNES